MRVGGKRADMCVRERECEKMQGEKRGKMLCCSALGLRAGGQAGCQQHQLEHLQLEGVLGAWWQKAVRQQDGSWRRGDKARIDFPTVWACVRSGGRADSASQTGAHRRSKYRKDTSSIAKCHPPTQVYVRWVRDIQLLNILYL